MTPREWAAYRQAAALRGQDDTRRLYDGAVLYSQALAGKLAPLASLLEGEPVPIPPHLPRAAFDAFSAHIGTAARKASPEALAALERMKTRGGHMGHGE